MALHSFDDDNIEVRTDGAGAGSRRASNHRARSASSAQRRLLVLTCSFLIVVAGLSIVPSGLAQSAIAQNQYSAGEGETPEIPSSEEILQDSPFKDHQLAPARVPSKRERNQAAAPSDSQPDLPRIERWTPGSHTTYLDGEAQTSYFSQPTFKRTEEGWGRLSGRLSQVGTQKVRANEALFPATFATSGSRVLELSLPGGKVSFTLEGARLSKPTLSKLHGQHTLRYQEVFPGVDLLYEVQGAKIKESFIIKNRQAQQAFDFTIRDPRKLLGEASPTGDGGYSFGNEVTEDTTIGLSAPVAWSTKDLAQRQENPEPSAEDQSLPDLFGPATQELTPTQDGYTLQLALDDAWANDSEFPVVLDPTIAYSYGAGSLVSGSAPSSTTACSGSPCPLLSNVDGSTFVSGNDDNLDVAYYHMDLSNIPSDTDIARAEFTAGWTYGFSWAPIHADTELHRVDTALPSSPTGADVAAAADPEILPGGESVDRNAYPDLFTRWFDVTDAVRHWVQNGLGANAGLMQKATTKDLADAQYQSPWLSGDCSTDPWASGDYCYYNPTLTIDYLGEALPPPLPVTQTWGCTCRWYHGPDVVNHEGDPVSTASGHMVEHFVDLSVKAPGVPVSFSRTYNGQDTADGPLGVGWTHEYASSLSVEPVTGDVVFRDPTGGQLVYRAQPGGTYLGDPGVLGDLTSQPGGGWTLQSTTGEVLAFNADGLETSDKDAAGDGVTLAYTGSGPSAQLTTLTDSAGNVTTLTYGTTGAATGNVIAVTTDDGRAVQYGYTTVAGKPYVTSVTDPDGHTSTYDYDTTTGALTGITDPLGQDSAQNTYDPVTDRITEQTDAEGNTLHFDWDPSTDLGAPDGTGTQTTTDDNGDPVATDTYYGNVLVEHTDGEGNATRYGYDAELNLVFTLNPRGNVTEMTYDSHGNMLTKTTRARTAETWTYDVNDNVDTYTDARGETTDYSYDGNNRLTSVKDPLNHTTTFTYTAEGLLETEATPEGRTSTYGYDAAGNMLSRTSPGGHETTYTYDAAGNVLTETDPRGNLPGATAADFTTTYTYDDSGRVLTTTDPFGTITDNTYDDGGHLVHVTTTDANSYTTQDTTYTYNDNGQPLTTTNFTQATLTNTYDLRGRLATSTDADGGVTSYVYDDANRVISKVTPRGNAFGSNPLSFTWYYQYDANSNLVATTDRDGRVTRTEYDWLDRPRTQVSPLGHRTTSTYDSNGNVVAITDPLGNETVYGYDDAGRLQSERLPGDQFASSYAYDDDGLRTYAMSPSGNSATIWTYDDDGNIATVVDPLASNPCCTASQHTITYGYDAAGNQTSVTDQLGHQTTWTYDAANRQLTKTNPRGHTTSYAYDLVGRLTSVTAPSDNPTQPAVTGYDYDEFGNVVHKIDPLGNTTYYTFNGKRQVTSVTDPLGRTDSYYYDPEGNVEGIFNGRANAPGANPNDFYVYPVHDQRGLLLGTATPDSESTSWYDYDDDGHLISTADDVMGISDLTYDNAGRLTQLEQPSGDFNYTYDPAGRVTTRDYQWGPELTYSYNDDGLVDQLTEDDRYNTPTSFSFDYNPGQALTKITYPASTGMTETRTYDRAGRVASIQTKNPSAANPLSRFDYTRDANGNPTLITRTRGTTVHNESLTYNDRDWLSSWCPGVTTCAGATNRVDHAYDLNGNITTENRQGTVDDPGVIANTYDDADELTTQAITTSSGTTNASFDYDSDGNLTTGGRTWNVLDQMTASNVNAADETTYTYDALANRRTATVDHGSGPEVQKVLWDINNPMPMPALVSEPSTDTTTQVYAPDGTLLESRHLWQAYDADYFGHDAMGSITDAYKPNGTPTWAMDYDPWGANVLTTGLTSGAIDPYFTYTGAYTERATGDVSLRARDYSPVQGRFSSTDPVSPTQTDPYISTYSYANNQPTLLTDPTGMCPWCISAVVGAVGGAVVGGVIYAVTADDFSVGGLAAAAGAGAVAGGLAGLTMGASLAIGGTAGALIGAAAAGAVGTVAYSLVTAQGMPSASEIAIGAAIGLGTLGLSAVVSAAIKPVIGPRVSALVQRLCKGEAGPGPAGAGAAASKGFNIVPGGSGSRAINYKPRAADPNWGLTPAHLNKHLFGTGKNSLRSIDPAGNPDLWRNYMQDLAGRPVTNTLKGGIEDIIGTFPKADGSGTFQFGIRIAPTSDGSYDLVTLLTKQ